MLGRGKTAPRKRARTRPAEKSAPGFLKWLRGRPCYLAGHRLGGCGVSDTLYRPEVEAAHVDRTGDKGMATKVSDRFAIPLCQQHHDEQHGATGSFRERGGWLSFQDKYRFNALDVAADYWRAWPGRPNWEASHAED